jgi:branched-subunit amino acid ABC-type transport system permease component
VLEAIVGDLFSTPGAAEMAVLILVIGTLVIRPRGLLGTEGAT